MQNYMICPKADECETCGEPSHNKPHRYIKNCAFLSNNCPACVPYSLRTGDRVRNVYGDTGTIKAFVGSGRYASVYNGSKCIGDIFIHDLEYLPPEVEENQKAFGDREAYKNFYSHSQAFLLKLGPDGTARTIAPTYRWTGKPLTPGNLWRHGEISSDCFTSQFIELCRHFDIYNFAFSLDDKKLLDWAIKVPVRIKWLIEKGFYEDVKLEWLLG